MSMTTKCGVILAFQLIRVVSVATAGHGNDNTAITSQVRWNKVLKKGPCGICTPDM